jgi:hypothetical protein
MADRHSLQHNPNLVAQTDSRVTNQWTRLGENVGFGPDAPAIFNAFMNSPGHRNNILGDYNRIGVGSVRDGAGLLWVAVVFVKGPPIASVAPFATTADFVQQQYRDFLGREADDAGVQYWVGKLSAGQLNAPGTVESFLHSPEFGGVIAPVVRLFLAAHPGAPTATALLDAIAAVRDGASLVDVAAGIVGPGGAAGLVAAASDPGFRWNTAHEVEVTMAYVGLLRRTPEDGGFSYWVWQMDIGRSVVDLLAGFLASPEYASRF